MSFLAKKIKICMISLCGLLGLSSLALAQSQAINYPTVASLSSVKLIVGQIGTFKKNLTFSSGEVSIGMSAAQVNKADLVDSLQYLKPGNGQQGLVTLCPYGSKDNEVLPECAVVGIARTYPVQKENMERWLSEITPQLIGQAQWDVSPNNNLHNFMLKNVMSIEPAFDQCIERVLQTKDSMQACFQASSKEEVTAIIFRLCYGELKNLENGLDLNSNISTPITFCAVDRKTGLVASLYFDEVKNRVTVALSTPVSIYEIFSRSKALETQQIQKQYTPPKL